MSATAAEGFRTGIAAHRPGEIDQPSRRRISRLDTPAASGRGVRPRPRPPAVSSPLVAGRSLLDVRACTAEAGNAVPLRLTERGMAVIVVAVLMLLVSAVVVIGLTVVRVTGPNYVPYGQTFGVDR